MTEGWRWIEPCCGSAAVALGLLGARRPMLPYQGSKWRFRSLIADLLRQDGPLVEVVLDDAGPWGWVAPTVLGAHREEVIGHLRAFADEDPRQVHARLHRAPVPDDPARYAAEFLFLQRLAFSGKAVGDRGGRWSSPGFNPSSAYGLAGTERFGRVSPMLPSLVRVLCGYAALAPVAVTGARRASVGPDDLPRRTVVYLDPPYGRTTRYPGGALDRAAVVALASAWAAAGATVGVSEAEPLVDLVARGWRAVRLSDGRGDRSPFRGQQEEWITLWAASPPASQDAA